MIYLLLPAYNEESSLPKLIPKVFASMEEMTEDFHLVVVNDGSYDSTGDILEDYQRQYGDKITVLKHKLNRGLGETERDGFEHIVDVADRDDVIIRVEGDDTHDPQYIRDLYNRLKEGYDVVNTSRFQKGGDQKGLDLYRRTISRAANLFMKLVFNIRGVKDYSCGFRAYRVSILQDALSIFGNNLIQLRGLGFTATLEMIVKLNLMGCRFAEVPFVLRYDLKESESKMVTSITSFGYLTMALLYHWPFGGWRSQFRGLREMYRNDPSKAVKSYNSFSLKRRTVSQINV